MLNRFDIASLALALGVHAAIGYRLFRAIPMPPRKPSVLEVDVRARKSPPVAQARSATRPATPRIVEPIVRRAPKAPPPPTTETAASPSSPPIRPVFGVQMDSANSGPSSFVVPLGNTTNIDPRQSARHDAPPLPLPPAGGGSTSASARGVLAIKTMPEIDSDACGRMITYPKEAASSGIEGDVRLRVSLDATGKVTGVRVLTGLGHGLDAEAVDALTHKCKFSPAVANDGRAVPFVIDPYVFHFEIPR